MKKFVLLSMISVGVCMLASAPAMADPSHVHSVSVQHGDSWATTHSTSYGLCGSNCQRYDAAALYGYCEDVDGVDIQQDSLLVDYTFYTAYYDNTVDYDHNLYEAYVPLPYPGEDVYKVWNEVNFNNVDLCDNEIFMYTWTKFSGDNTTYERQFRI